VCRAVRTHACRRCEDVYLRTDSAATAAVCRPQRRAGASTRSCRTRSAGAVWVIPSLWHARAAAAGRAPAKSIPVGATTIDPRARSPTARPAHDGQMRAEVPKPAPG